MSKRKGQINNTLINHDFVDYYDTFYSYSYIFKCIFIFTYVKTISAVDYLWYPAQIFIPTW